MKLRYIDKLLAVDNHTLNKTQEESIRMKALILNSGLGSRMGVLTSEHPKCMTDISSKDTILSRQLKILVKHGIKEVIMTTGLFDSVLINYCNSLELPINFTFVNNPLYKETNYIYSIYCARQYLDDDIILMHGDLVFENEVFNSVMEFNGSCVTVSSTLDLPQKDFKAVVDNGFATKIGIEFFNNAMASQPLYKLMRSDWKVWLSKIIEFCENSNKRTKKVYSIVLVVKFTFDNCFINCLDIKNLLCSEIDNPEDLIIISSKLKEIENRTVYMCFSTDILHSGHIEIIRKASNLGKLIIGVLSDEAVCSFKRMPLLPFEERKAMLENILLWFLFNSS